MACALHWVRRLETAMRLSLIVVTTAAFLALANPQAYGQGC
ncbi:hypothetical protein OAX78_03160 [Planctomycetota bacterium]|nr:hypothetical protein [Planctomycetota bacterium]